MKKLLSLLLAYVFLSVQSWAISGGPFGVAGDPGLTIGTFAGVLVGDEESSTDDGDAAIPGGSVDLPGDNSLGVFVLGIPQTGIGSGLFVYFTQGRTYAGTLIGVADPDTLSFRGLVKAQFNIDINAAVIIDPDGDVTPITFSFPAGYANGSIDAEIAGGGLSSSGGIGLATRLEGTAELAVQDADPITGSPAGPISSLNLRVDGFKQSPTSDFTADLASFGLSITSTTTGG